MLLQNRRRQTKKPHRMRRRHTYFGGSKKRRRGAAAPPLGPPLPDPPQDDVESFRTEYKHDHCDEYIKEWMAIQNIVSDREFGKRYLEKLPAGTRDACTESRLLCLDPRHSECSFYQSSTGHKTCVRRTRIKLFKANNLAHKLFGKNKQAYKIVDSKLLQDSWKLWGEPLPKHLPDIYYYVYISESTSHIYVNFSTGRALSQRVNLYAQINEFLGHLIDDIRSQTLAIGQKVVLCGHSFGCVLALYTGILIFNEDREFFDTHIIIVGSAPFKFYNDLGDFKDLTNVKVFALYTYPETSKPETGADGEVDSFITTGPSYAVNYKTMIFLNAADDDGGVITQSAIKGKIFRENVHLHDWNKYYETLKNTIYAKKLKR